RGIIRTKTGSRRRRMRREGCGSRRTLSHSTRTRHRAGLRVSHGWASVRPSPMLGRYSSAIRAACANQRSCGSVRGAISDGRPYRDLTTGCECKRLTTPPLESLANRHRLPCFWEYLRTPVSSFACVKSKKYNSSPMLNRLLAFVDLLGTLLDLGHLGSRISQGKRTAFERKLDEIDWGQYQTAYGVA